MEAREPEPKYVCSAETRDELQKIIADIQGKTRVAVAASRAPHVR